MTPVHANTLYNYAVLLDTHLQRKNEAESLYRRAIDIEPRHAYALYNLAVLLEEKYANEGVFLPPNSSNSNHNLTPEVIRQRKQEAGLFYQRAAEADPRDATTLADYGRYIFVRLENPTMAEPLLTAALKLDVTCEVALYHLALLLFRERKATHLDQAENLLRQVIGNNPQHANGMLTLARLFADAAQAMFKSAPPTGNGTVPAGYVPSSWASKSKETVAEECVALYEKAIALAKEPAFIAAEFLKFVSMYGSNKAKVRRSPNLTNLLRSRVTFVAYVSSVGSGQIHGAVFRGTGHSIDDDCGRKYIRHYCQRRCRNGDGCGCIGTSAA